MPWFCAHIVQSFHYRERGQDSFPVYENIHIIEATDADDAWDKAEAIVKRSNTIYNPGLTLDGRPVRVVFEGIRTMISVSHDTTVGVLTRGDEVTYLKLELKTADDLAKFLKGEAVEVEFCSD